MSQKTFTLTFLSRAAQCTTIVFRKYLDDKGIKPVHESAHRATYGYDAFGAVSAYRNDIERNKQSDELRIKRERALTSARAALAEKHAAKGRDEQLATLQKSLNELQSSVNSILDYLTKAA